MNVSNPCINLYNKVCKFVNVSFLYDKREFDLLTVHQVTIKYLKTNTFKIRVELNHAFKIMFQLIELL